MTAADVGMGKLRVTCAFAVPAARRCASSRNAERSVLQRGASVALRLAAGLAAIGQHALVRRIEVEVFPIEPSRWIAVMEAPAGPFSTEASTPELVEDETRKAIVEVLGWSQVKIVYRDDLGDPWSPSRAAEQATRLLNG